MRQVQDTLVWIAMILVVAGVLYVMPRVADYVDTIENDRAAAAACVSCRQVTLAHHDQPTHHHH
jgi:hypothetical protein